MLAPDIDSMAYDMYIEGILAFYEGDGDDYLEEPYVWETKSGKKIPIEQMTVSHIKRCMNMFSKNSLWYQVFKDELARRRRVLDELGFKGTKLEGI